MGPRTSAIGAALVAASCNLHLFGIADVSLGDFVSPTYHSDHSRRYFEPGNVPGAINYLNNVQPNLQGAVNPCTGKK